MSVEELNALIEDAYAAALAFEEQLTRIYLVAFDRAAQAAAESFERQAIVAAGFVAPQVQTLTSGMTVEEQEEAASVRRQAALAVAAALAAIGLSDVGQELMDALAARGSENFDLELLRILRSTIDQAGREGWTVEQTTLKLQSLFAGASPATAQLIAQTELTTLVNERSMQAALRVSGEQEEPLFKVWQTRQDGRVRAAHLSTQGQTVPVDQPFNVVGYSMMYPGDSSAPFSLVARCRCRMSYTDSLTAAAARPDVSGKCMVAVYPRQMEARAISGEAFDTFHCTLMFLGAVEDLAMDVVHAAVERAASACQPMEGSVGGVGFFAAGEDGHPILALPSVQGLSFVREMVATELLDEGIESPSEHGWMPHMTLSYADSPEVPDLALLGESLHFDYVSVVVADERTNYRLGGNLAASAEEVTLMPMTEIEETTTTAALTVTITDDQVDDDGNASAEAVEVAWKALLAIEGQPTEDGRLIEVGALTWRDLPLSLMAMDETGPGGHQGAEVAGRIDNIWRDGNEVWGEGVFSKLEFGQKIAGLVEEQSLRGNSVDLAVLKSEYRNAETGEPLTDDELMDAFWGEDIPILFVVTDGVIMASTVCPTPAIAGAEIMLASGQVIHMNFTFTVTEGDVVTASAAGLAPLHPPLEWYSNPRLNGPTALTVTSEGKVFGHAALWNSCHIGEPSGPGICVPPPRSGMQYEIFHHGVVETAEGVDVPCGQITMSTLHAGRDLSWKATLQHYEHSGMAVADVIAGEDAYGIWVSGGLRPDLPAERVRELKAGSLSGDWRQVIGRGLEFLAALVVNIPGFPIPRPEARIVASAIGEEEVLALVAAGIVTPEDEAGMSRREYLRQIEMLTHEK